MDPINSWVDAAEVRRLAASLVAPAAGAEDGPAACYGEQFVGFARPGGERPPSSASNGSTGAHARQALAGARVAAERGGLLTSSAPPATPEAALLTKPQPAVAVPAPPAPAPVVPAPAAAAPAVEAARPPAPAQAPAPPPAPAAPEGYLIERLKAYGEWLHRAVSAKAFFVADREGELLIDEIQSPKLLQVARTLAHASWSASRQAGGGGSVGSLHVKLGAGSVMEVLTVASRYGPLILGIVVPALLPAAAVQVVADGLEKAVNAPVQRS